MEPLKFDIKKDSPELFDPTEIEIRLLPVTTIHNQEDETSEDVVPCEICLRQKTSKGQIEHRIVSNYPVSFLPEVFTGQLDFTTYEAKPNVTNLNKILKQFGITIVNK